MPLEQRSSTPEELPAEPLSPLLNREAVEAGNGWLARFAPLLGEINGLSAEAVRQRLDGLPELRSDGEQVLQGLRPQAAAQDAGLMTTLEEALRELDGQEIELRRRLAVLAPGDPGGAVDLAQLRARMAETQARREVQAWTGTALESGPKPLELVTSPPNYPAAFMTGLFALGWLSFTTVHAIFMIGGFWHVFGPGALLLLLFYSLFFAAGFAMAAAGVGTASREEIRLEGRRLRVRRRFLGITRERSYTLDREARAARATRGVEGQGRFTPEIAVPTENGGEVRLASARPDGELNRNVKQINEYLAAFESDEAGTRGELA